MSAKSLQRGFVPIFALIIPMMVALSLVLGAAVYKLAAETDGGSGSEMTNQDVAAAMYFFENVILTTTNIEIQDEAASNALAVMAKYVKQEAPKVLAIDFCDATMEDIFRAVALAEQAIKAGLEDERIALLDWAGMAFRSYIPEVVLALGQNIHNEYNNPEEVLRLDKPYTSARYKMDKAADKERENYSTLSNLLGLDNLARDIKLGKYIQPMCIQLWDAAVNAEFHSDDGSGHIEKWKQIVTVPEVPVYKYDQDLKLPFMSKHIEKPGKFTENYGSYYDGGLYVPCKIEGDMIWQVLMDGESHEDLWSYKIIVKTTPRLLDHGGIKVGCADGLTTTLESYGIMDRAEFEIPMLLFWKAKPFEANVVEFQEGISKGTVNVMFIPSRRVTVKELKEMMYN